jgi:hypothetical protein
VLFGVLLVFRFDFFAGYSEGEVTESFTGYRRWTIFVGHGGFLLGFLLWLGFFLSYVYELSYSKLKTMFLSTMETLFRADFTPTSLGSY